MHSIITEELRFRKRVCEYAIKSMEIMLKLHAVIILVDNKYNVG